MCLCGPCYVNIQLICIFSGIFFFFVLVKYKKGNTVQRVEVTLIYQQVQGMCFITPSDKCPG